MVKLILDFILMSLSVMETMQPFCHRFIGTCCSSFHQVGDIVAIVAVAPWCQRVNNDNMLMFSRYDVYNVTLAY